MTAQQPVHDVLTRAASARSGPKGSGGRGTADFLARYYRHVASEDLAARGPEALRGMALSHRELAGERPEGEALVRVYTPTNDVDGWDSPRTIIQIVLDDMPFLVDSVTNAVLRAGHGVHLIVHPQLIVRRTAAGRLESVVGDDSTDRPRGVIAESWMSLEIDSLAAEHHDELEQLLRETLDLVRISVEDWPKMRAHCLTLGAELRGALPAGVSAAEGNQSADFLDWLANNHFTFLGYREYQLRTKGRRTDLTAIPGTGLGLLRGERSNGRPNQPLTRAAVERARDEQILVITKASSRSPIHRDAYLDYIAVKTYDTKGRVTGEKRFLGLYASSAYNDSINDIPILRERAQEVLRLSGFTPESHSGKDILQVLETYPRDEIIQTGAERLARVAGAVLHLPERRTSRIFLRPDDFGRFMSCLVYIPRDRYTTAVRLRIQQILLEELGGETIDYTTRVSETSLARLHFVVRVPAGAQLPDVDEQELEARIVRATRTWDEDLAAELVRVHGEFDATSITDRYAGAFSEAYKETFAPEDADDDIARLDQVAEGGTQLALYRDPSRPDTERRFKLYRGEELLLTHVMPVFTHMGVEVTDERPYEVEVAGEDPRYIYDFGLSAPDGGLWSGEGLDDDEDEVTRRFEEAVAAVWEGLAESDGFNALVLRAGLTWRQVVILRTVAKYLRQTQSVFSQDYVESTLTANPHIARDLVRYFETCFDPAAGPAEGSRRTGAAEEVHERIIEALDDVSSLDQDRIIRSMLAVMAGTLRTSFYQRDADDRPKPYVALKLSPRDIPGLPAPRPMFEIWVYSPSVEGVHLRFGKVARGGLRWSDRREDFRTEVLGLVKAQMVKNAVIVPTGSKGGFYAKNLPDPAADREAWMAGGVAAYKTFISALLDVTDNLLAGKVHPPADVVRHDEDDTYLVVAADKGTAKFSDTANEISREHGFWLDDAFASGGSAGYDHKAMGITARGAWESVKRHFREMGVDTQSEDFTAVGIGDMSGDVFGNGMLLSKHIRLVAAFDHRHVFIDPEPDAARSWTERKRLFELPGSSWADYDTTLISRGGGVFPRSAKSVRITGQMVKALGLPEGTTSMTPSELIHAALKAPVDLLWNGGIGTYVKASSETNDRIGDRANDAIRVDGKDLRCKVIGEGGNLGASQLGRIEAARSGVRVNTDAIDNSAGVDTSDHEVNIKILLAGLTREGTLTMEKRNELLASMTDDVAKQVLTDNYEQNVLLGNARFQQHSMLTVHQRLIRWLEEHRDLDRALEFLPSDAELNRRNKEGEGLSSPEFSVLVAYAKLAIKDELIASGLPDDEWFTGTLASYFPEALRTAYPDEIEAHPLRREIIVNAVANSMINRGGITFAFRAFEETGASTEQVARAYVVCREIFGLSEFTAAVEELDNVVSTETQTMLYLEFRRLFDRAVRWFLTNRPAALDIRSEIERFGPCIERYGSRIGSQLLGSERDRYDARVEELKDLGVPEELAKRTAGVLDEFSLLDIVELAHDTDEPLEHVLPVYFATSEGCSIDKLLFRVSALPRATRWDALARAAMREDLYAVLELLVRSVLDSSAPSSSAQERFAQWAKRHSDALTRARSSLRGVEELDQPGLAAVSVALRTLRTVTRPTSRTPEGQQGEQPADRAAAQADSDEPGRSGDESVGEVSNESAPVEATKRSAESPVKKAAAAKSAPAGTKAAASRTAKKTTSKQPAKKATAKKPATKKAATKKATAKKTAKKATGGGSGSA